MVADKGIVATPAGLEPNKHTKSGPDDVSNDRHINLTFIACNFFERVLRKALLFFRSDSRAISPHRHGFLPRRRCLFNLLVFEEEVACMMDEGHTIDVSSLDLSKACDPVNSRFLLSFGLSDVVVQRIEAFFIKQVW